MKHNSEVEQLRAENARLRSALRAVHTWWTIDAADTDEEMPASVFDGMCAALASDARTEGKP